MNDSESWSRILLSRKGYWILFACVIVLYFSLALCRASSAQPWNDEAWYSAPSLNLIRHGNTGTPYLETTHKFWKGIDKVTYWVVPLQFFAQVPWIELFGFSLLKMRLFAILWGSVSLLSWSATVAIVTRKQWCALLTMLFIACDYQFVSQVSLARMDAMALGLSSLAFCLYLVIRSKSLPWALFIALAAAVGSGLTHPTAGVPALIGVIFLIVYLDYRRLRPIHLLVAAAPFCLGAAFWIWYASAAPELFRAQFLGNVTDIDRLGGFSHPLRAIWRECLRYWGMSGFAPGMNPLYRIKILVVILYVASAAFCLWSKKLRREMNASTLVWLWLTYLVTMTFYENTKEVKYGIHIVCLYDALLAISIVYLWIRSPQTRLSRLFPAAAAVSFLLISVGGVLYTTLAKDDLHTAYLPAAQYLNANARSNDLIMAGSEFGFALGFDRNVVDDNDFTYYSHKQPRFILIGNAYRSDLMQMQRAHPDSFRYFASLLTTSYHRVYKGGEYEIFQLNE